MPPIVSIVNDCLEVFFRLRCEGKSHEVLKWHFSGGWDGRDGEPIELLVTFFGKKSSTS